MHLNLPPLGFDASLVNSVHLYLHCGKMPFNGGVQPIKMTNVSRYFSDPIARSSVYILKEKHSLVNGNKMSKLLKERRRKISTNQGSL